MIGFWLAFLSAAVLALPILGLLRKLKSRQIVSQHAPESHQAKQGTPTMGGLIILAGTFVGTGLALALLGPRGNGASHILWVLLTLASFAAIGFVDDFVVPRLMSGKRGLGWKQKILMQLVAALPAVPACGLEWTPLNVAAVIFVVLFCSNAYNFADGLDGLAGGIGLILIYTLSQMSGSFNAWDIEIVGALLGSIVVFLFLNAPPAKVFMGDVGSLPIGAFIGIQALGVLSHGAPATLGGPTTLGGDATLFLGLFVTTFMLFAELVPVPLQIFAVKVFKRKLFPYTPIHHAFEKAGWPESRVVWSFLLAQILCSAGGHWLFLMGVSARYGG